MEPTSRVGVDVTKKRRAHHDEAWAHAKQICRLSARQVEMARALGMNPKKLRRLRPAPQEHWKLPVGAFIEECYWKRFGGGGKNQPRQSESPSRAVQALEQVVDPPQHVRDSASQVSSLVCYLTNLAEDLQRWLAYGAIDPEVLSEVREELADIARTVGTDAPIPEISEIPVPPERPRQRGRSRRREEAWEFDDDEMPF